MPPTKASETITAHSEQQYGRNALFPSLVRETKENHRRSSLKGASRGAIAAGGSLIRRQEIHCMLSPLSVLGVAAFCPVDFCSLLQFPSITCLSLRLWVYSGFFG